jgi:hypothetical protein
VRRVVFPSWLGRSLLERSSLERSSLERSSLGRSSLERGLSGGNGHFTGSAGLTLAVLLIRIPADVQIRMYRMICYQFSILCRQSRAQALRFVQDDNVEPSGHRHLQMTTFNDNSE